MRRRDTRIAGIVAEKVRLALWARRTEEKEKLLLLLVEIFCHKYVQGVQYYITQLFSLLQQFFTP
jgi:hypothetical protein